jgi:hypothetical protein
MNVNEVLVVYYCTSCKHYTADLWRAKYKSSNELCVPTLKAVVNNRALIPWRTTTTTMMMMRLKYLWYHAYIVIVIEKFFFTLHQQSCYSLSYSIRRLSEYEKKGDRLVFDWKRQCYKEVMRRYRTTTTTA